MKLDAAKSTALGMSWRFGADFAVFRMPGWNPDEYGVRRVDELPAGAEIAETFTKATAPTTAPAPDGKDAQRGLFE